MKSFQHFLSEEAKLKGNVGVPEEKLREIEQKAQQEKGIRIDDPSQERQFGSQISGLIQRSRQLMFGGKSKAQCEEIQEKLVDLAKNVIMNEYGEILQNVDLDINLVPFGEVAKELPEIRQVRRTPSEEDIKREAEKLKEPEKKAEVVDKKKDFMSNLLGGKKQAEDWLKTREYKISVDVAKLINAIGQGEAKNTKHLLHDEVVKNGLREIFGRQSEELFKVWDDTSKVADKLDWLVPIERKAQWMADMPGGMAGAVKVSWPEAEQAKQEEDSDELSQDFPSSNDAEDILKRIEEGQDLNDNKEEIAELFSNGNPKIKVVGVDFPMLLHETVKGIYQLIGSAWIPGEGSSEKEVTKAKIVKSATSSFEDEAEEFRYGTYLAAALRDFINSCPNVDRYPNIRQHVWGEMCYMARTERGKEEFLELFKGILEKTDKAKKQISDMIQDIISRIREYEISQIDKEAEPEYKEEEPEYPQEGEEDEIDKLIRQTQEKPAAVEGGEVDYSTMSRKELDAELNAALDSGDKETLDAISKELQRRNESVMLQIYGDEIQKLLNS